MIAYTQSLPSVFVKQLHTKARIRTKAGGCGVEPHTQTAFGSLLPPRGATQKLCAPVSKRQQGSLLVFTTIGIRRSYCVIRNI